MSAVPAPVKNRDSPSFSTSPFDANRRDMRDYPYFHGLPKKRDCPYFRGRRS